MIKTLFRKFIKARFENPSFRYGGPLDSLTLLLQYTPKEQMLHDALWFTHFNQVEGDYLEFGIGTGSTFAAAYHFLRYLEKRQDATDTTRRHCYGFDSFKGLPVPKEVDVSEVFKEGDYAYSLPEVCKLFYSSKVDLEQVTLIPGWFKDSLKQPINKLYQAAVVWIDCDLYESAVSVLSFITPLIQQGTVIIFDDWFTFKGSSQKGEQRAIAEWKTENPHISLNEFKRYGWHGISFLVDK